MNGDKDGTRRSGGRARDLPALIDGMLASPDCYGGRDWRCAHQLSHGQPAQGRLGGYNPGGFIGRMQIVEDQ
jgi:hypothetical protein